MNQRDDARLRLIVKGRVQGVFFRRAAADEARDLSLTGWVRNLPTGAVEMVAEGRRRNLEVLAAWAHQGPPGAHVSEVEQEWQGFQGEFARFSIRLD